ncbi:MAG: hypothetical protein ACYYK0_00970 [Candidatus Eutrophobiaceae bacterium]
MKEILNVPPLEWLTANATLFAKNLIHPQTAKSRLPEHIGGSASCYSVVPLHQIDWNSKRRVYGAIVD